VAITAGVVGDALLSAALALLEVRAEGGRATLRDCTQNPALRAPARVGANVLVPVRPDDIGHLEPRALLAGVFSRRYRRHHR
jgi:hypothetical protein